MLSILPDDETTKEVRNILAEHLGSDKISTLDVIELLGYFEDAKLKPEGTDESEPYPYSKNNKLWSDFVSSGRYTGEVAQRLDMFIKEPDLNTVATQICNERGLYE